MPYNRRRFLLISGSLCGVGIATLAHQVFSRNPTPSQAPPTLPSPQAVAPARMYAPLRGDVRIVVISDLNSQYGSTSYESEVDKAITLIPDWQPDLVLCGGDMIAGQKRSLFLDQIQAMWAAFDQHIAAPLRKARIPFGFTIGNHDGSGAIAQGKFVFASDRELAAAYWNQPEHDPGLPFSDRAGFPFYYTFTQKDVFYLVWDASTHQILTEQLAWVEKSLATPAAQQAKLRIAIGHLPLYPVAMGRDNAGNYLENAEKLQSLLEHYHVHTYVSGHHHAYYPGKRGQLELLHTGALGSGPRQLLNSNLPPTKTLTIVDIHKLRGSQGLSDLNSASTTYTTYDLKTMVVVDIQTLPKAIGKVWRRDLAPSLLGSSFSVENKVTAKAL